MSPFAIKSLEYFFHKFLVILIVIIMLLTTSIFTLGSFVHESKSVTEPAICYLLLAITSKGLHLSSCNKEHFSGQTKVTNLV
jgi:hypothetical protein